MFEERLKEIANSIAAEYEQVVASTIPEKRNPTAGVYFVHDSSINSFGHRLPIMVFNWLDWESDDEIKRRMREHLDAYFAERSKV